MAWCYLDLNDIGVLDAGASLSQAFLDANDGDFYSHHAIALVALGILLGARGRTAWKFRLLIGIGEPSNP